MELLTSLFHHDHWQQLSLPPLSQVTNIPSPQFLSFLIGIPLVALSIINVIYSKLKPLPKSHPPIVQLTEHQIFETPRESYENALKEHGPVIAVKRKGILEFIVSREFTRRVLTDDLTFSFERGVAFTLNLNFIQSLTEGKFFKHVDTLVNEGVTPRLDAVIKQIYPVFHENAIKALRLSQQTAKPGIDMFELAHRTVSEAMILLILGRSYLTPSMQQLVIDTASGFAAMSGVTNNTSHLARHHPRIERFLERFKYVATVGIPFAFTLAPAIWSDLGRLERETDLSKDVDPNTVTLMAVLARQHSDKNGRLRFTSKILIIFLIIMLIFASVHQTASVMVWVVFELATRPEYLSTLQDEANALIEPPSDPSGAPTLTYDALKRAHHLDSFIREVMRTKGDTLNHIRVTTIDTPLGGYIIPKGSPVLPLTSLTHFSTDMHGDKAGIFDGFRYVDTDKHAALTGTSYVPFGLNRWACPGRFLAVAEIKMMIMSLISTSSPSLVGGRYEIVDKLNITSVPPAGELVLNPLR